MKHYKQVEVCNNGRWTIYEFDKELTRCFRGDTPMKSKYVCISDARTHTERLVFSAYKDLDGGWDIDLLHIAGKMSILGGDASTVNEHEYYLNELVRYNYDNEQESTD